MGKVRTTITIALDGFVAGPLAESILGNVGATIMGRNMFDCGLVSWGDDPPYRHSVFVLTHHCREPLALQGGTTFFFVTTGIESALDQAKDEAGERDVSIAGGANVVQQYLAAGLLDELLISVAPVVLGGGARLFDNVQAIGLTRHAG